MDIFKRKLKGFRAFTLAILPLLVTLKLFSQQPGFIENKGQWPNYILFRADVPGGQMLATSEGMLIGAYDIASLRAVNRYNNKTEELGATPNSMSRPRLKGHGWLLRFVGSQPGTAQSISKQGQSADYYNYLVGNPSTFATNVYSFSQITYKNIYPGIDVKYYQSPNSSLENDIIIKPGGDAKKVRLKIDGIDGLKLNETGELVLSTTVGEITIPAPVSYLTDGQINRPIAVKYLLSDDGTVAFDIPGYDKDLTLVIDPIVMRWATWVSNNSSVDAHNHAIDLDVAGNIYVTGKYGQGLITTIGAFQDTSLSLGFGSNIFIGKYTEPAVPSGSGTRIWQTYLGGTGSDVPYALNVGLDGYVYITGQTTSSLNKTYGTGFAAGNWPQRQRDSVVSTLLFVAKVDPSGTGALVREIGPITNDLRPTPDDIRLLPTGGNNFDLIVTANTNRSAATIDGDIPAAQFVDGTASTSLTGSGYVFRLTSDLNTLVWAKQYNTPTGRNQFKISTIDRNGNIYIAGLTSASVNLSYNNPSTQNGLVGNQDGWILKLKPADGSVSWSRYLNSDSFSNTQILCMELNQQQTQLVMGGITSGLSAINVTTSSLHPNNDFFVASIPVTGASTTWGTYFGGTYAETNMMGLNVDQNNDVYVLGYTNSKDIPVTNFPVQDGTYDSLNSDAIFFKLDGRRGDSLLYSTYLGGAASDYDPIGERGIKFNQCRIYLAITSQSPDFPLTSGTLTSSKLSVANIGEPLLVSMANPPDLQGNNVTGGGNQNLTCGQTPQSIIASQPSYLVPNIIRNNVLQVDSTAGAYPVGLPVITSFQWQISIDTGATWANLPGDTAQNLGWTNPLDLVGLIMFRRVIDGDACNRSSDTLAVARIHSAHTAPPVASQPTQLCVGQPLSITSTSSDNTVVYYIWRLPNGSFDTTQNIAIPITTAPDSGLWTLFTINANNCPSVTDTIPVSVVTSPAPVLTTNSPVCSGHSLSIDAAGFSVSAYSWTGPGSFSFNGANFISDSSTVSQSGWYTVTQTFLGCLSPPDSVRVTVYPNPSVTASVPNPVCVGGDIKLSSNPLAGTLPYAFNWSGPNGFAATIQDTTIANAISSMAGDYEVTITDANGCTANSNAVNISINQVATIAVHLSGDSLIADGGANWQWYLNGNAISGATSKIYIASSAGYYTVVVRDSAECLSTDSAEIANTGYVFPNAFTPNGDGKNDLFYPILQLGVKLNWIHIYNRWGQLVYEGSTGWNGKFNNKDQPTGTYIYYAELSVPDANNPTIFKNTKNEGAVSLLR